eukprot:jgi/Hompol1/4328/HPOL_007085-RA
MSMLVTPIPLFKDNYGYLLECTKTGATACVDPAEADRFLASVASLRPQANIQTLLTTHHHADHSGGNKAVAAAIPGIKVVGGDADRIPAITQIVADGDVLQIGSLKVTALSTPCHTTTHICYLVEGDDGDKAVFTGDTLFVGGCGRFFEGTAAQMHTALIKKLGSLPPATKVYCGHEYTVSNLAFAHSVEPENRDIADKLAWARSVECTVPSTIAAEHATNPFMRVENADLQKSLGA